MDTKLSQDAADSLQWHADRAKLDWERHKEASKPLGNPWTPTMTEQERAELAQHIANNNCPF